CQSVVYRLSSAGTVIQSYLPSTLNPVPTFLFAANLDPDGTTFWTGDYQTGDIYRVNIATGAQVTHFKAAGVNPMGGLAVFGEQRAATLASPSPSPSAAAAATAAPALPKAGASEAGPSLSTAFYALAVALGAAILSAGVVVTGR